MWGGPARTGAGLRACPVHVFAMNAGGGRVKGHAEGRVMNAEAVGSVGSRGADAEERGRLGREAVVASWALRRGRGWVEC